MELVADSTAWSNEGVETMTEANVAYEGSNVSPEALASLGEGHIAYVKQIRSEDVPGLFPQAPHLAPGLKLFALHTASGQPIMLTDRREAAIANAWSNQLQAVSDHGARTKLRIKLAMRGCVFDFVGNASLVFYLAFRTRCG